MKPDVARSRKKLRHVRFVSAGPCRASTRTATPPALQICYDDVAARMLALRCSAASMVTACGRDSRAADKTALGQSHRTTMFAMSGLGASFIVNGATPAQDSALVSAGGNFASLMLAKFDGEFASNSSTYGGTGTIRYRW